ncbi:ATP-grasp domain-containing protein [Micavibrio aeruginosavorus]|uniref:Ribosomal protein S6 glutaminyl transferase n=1 Tax=Micavibrio aeruginosavorus EPB TaxID=349215 RepID=M4VGZ0_9BACT|nr:RimK family alpha-L-glutamate ligase [Micavibrio aeruginosavorus]AGH97321.1 Ribosomal protein S6 glutaminyl transferase [Micavibrio aeruginosavorus EPB]
MKIWFIYERDLDTPEAFETLRYMEEGKKLGHDVTVYKPNQFEILVADGDAEPSILIDGVKTALPDVCFPYLARNENMYFCLAVIREMERQGVLVMNDAATIECVCDKLHTHQVLAQHNIPTPTTMLAKFPVDVKMVEKHLGFPVVVKTVLGTQGSGVFLLNNENEFTDMMAFIGETSSGVQLIMQKFVAASSGRDLRLFVVDGKVIGAMERRSGNGSFKANYSLGGSVAKFEPDAEAEWIAVKTARALGADIAGIDLLFTDDGHYTVCEANVFPGFKGLEKACGVNIPKQVYVGIENLLSEHRAARRATAAVATGGGASFTRWLGNVRSIFDTKTAKAKKKAA